MIDTALGLATAGYRENIIRVVGGRCNGNGDSGSRVWQQGLAAVKDTIEKRQIYPIVIGDQSE